jgi:hypothetical protein
MIKVVDVDCHMYSIKHSTARALLAKRGGGGVSNHPLKEYKFCAGIAKHDLVRKATG